MPNQKDGLQALLDSVTTFQKIRRMSFEILEKNFDQKDLILAGIEGQGYELACLIHQELLKITQNKVWLAKLSFEKHVKTQPEIQIESNVDTFKNKAVVIVDDVLNTGKTLAFSLRPFLSIPLKNLEVAVLVDRNHLLYPIHPTYVGYSLSTTLKEHIKVQLKEEEEQGVFLY